MLCELAVQNLALIEDVRVELRPGFCAWTGETGAGKSLLLGALGLLLGERGSTDLIRTGAEELRVTGRFDLSRPELRRQVEAIVEGGLEEDEVILSRRLTRAGRSHCYVNEQPVALTTLRRIGEVLVDIHGQRENQSLLEPAYQLELLDAFGKLDDLRQKYLDAADRVRELRARHTQLNAERRQRQRDLELLRFERDELERAAIKPNELPELTVERDRLSHAQGLQGFAVGSCSVLYDDEGSVVERVGRLQKEAESWAKVDPTLAEIAERLHAVVEEVRDVAETLRDRSEHYEADPVRQEEVEKRVALLKRLEVKYGRPADELIAYRASLDEQESRLQGEEDDLATIADELAAAFAKLRAAATDLSKARAKVARKLASETQKHLVELNMEGAKLDAVLTVTPLGDDPAVGEVPSQGIDSLELMLAANKGEPSRPLRKVASGGEMARTMLALKTVLAAHDKVGTLVFDEIDANIGGRLSDVLGQKLAALGRSHQVICVTHMAQVASYARDQWTIRKSRRGNRTTTTIHHLTEAERLEELSSMLRGESGGETTRQMVADMLETARRSW